MKYTPYPSLLATDPIIYGGKSESIHGWQSIVAGYKGVNTIDICGVLYENFPCRIESNV